MQFLYPYFLFALFAVAVPVIIHLFNFRKYKTVYFSNVQFLKNVRQETKSKSQLKHILVLLCRILAIASLVFAFAQPYQPVADNIKNTVKEQVSVYIDNSFSMDAETSTGKMLEIAKKRALNIVNTYPATSDFILITNDFEAKHQRKISKEEAVEFISEIQTSPRIRKFSEVFSRQKVFTNYQNKDEIKNTLYVLSDFQKSSSDIESIKNDSTLKVNFIPLNTQANKNLYIDSCYFSTPTRKLNQPEELTVKIRNFSSESYENIPIKLFLNDSLKTIASFNIEENSSKEVKLNYTNSQTGILNGRIEISDYPITYDNTFYFSYSLDKKVNVLVIGTDSEKYFKALFEKDEYFNINFWTEGNIKSSLLSKYKVVFLNQLKNVSSGFAKELANFVANGGTLVFSPNENGNVDSYNFLLKNMNCNFITGKSNKKTNIENINYRHEIYSGVFEKIERNINLPHIFKRFTFTNQVRINEDKILTTRNNKLALSSTPFGKGKIYTFSFPLSEESSSFCQHPIFVPTIYNIALFSQVSSNIYYTIGRDEIIPIQKELSEESYDVFHIANSKGDFDFIPQQTRSVGSSLSFNIRNNISKADNYFVISNKQKIEGIAFNYNRKESELEYFNTEELSDIIKKKRLQNFSLIDVKDEFLETAIQEMGHGKKYWKFFIVLALVFLAVEIGLLKFYK